ncbi:MAG: substrate-binding domain-containing protein [Planctomycetota bacterium]|jgi:phosphonate transport system substrate-binding protein
MSGKGNITTKRLWTMVAIGVLAVLAIAMMLRSFGIGSADGVIAVDFNNVVNAGNATETDLEDRQSILRAAAGAMVSPKKTRQQYDDLLRLIADRLQRRALLAQRKTYTEINDMIERREVDVAFVCSAPYVTGKAKFEMEILVVPVMYGQKVYHSYILTYRDSPLNSFDDLRGKVFAFTDPNSNSGCLVPKYMLSQRGENPETFFSEFYYTYSHDNSIRAVAEGMADGAAVDSLIWEYMQETDPTYTARTKIIEKSPPYGIPPVVVHPDLDPKLKHQLKNIFLNLHKDEEARSILGTIRIDQFEESEDAAYDSIREMQQQIVQTGGQEH